MNGKKAKALRRKAYKEWLKLKPEYQKIFTVKQVYKQIKKELKNK